METDREREQRRRAGEDWLMGYFLKQSQRNTAKLIKLEQSRINLRQTKWQLLLSEPCKKFACEAGVSTFANNKTQWCRTAEVAMESSSWMWGRPGLGSRVCIKWRPRIRCRANPPGWLDSTGQVFYGALELNSQRFANSSAIYFMAHF